MSDADTPAATNARAPAPLSAWAPFREPLFKSLWIAAVVSYTGTWMQNLGTGWLMTSLTMSPLLVSLVQAAMSLPVFLVALPAGALADMMDRRRMLLVTQGWMVLTAATLGVLTLLHVVTPWLLLLLTFLMGLAEVMNDPAWQAITPEIISGERHASAVALNSAGYNVARAVGPALGGLIIAAAGSGTAFLLNAASFFGVIFFLYRWKRRPHTPVMAGHVMTAISAGIKYVRHAPAVKAVLVRTAAFSVFASALLALLPLLARPFGSVGYGLLLGAFGLGACVGAAVLPRLRHALPVNRVVALAIVVFAAVVFAAGRAQVFWSLWVVLFIGGVAWIAILACLNVAAQTTAPYWVRARALSMYLLVLQGGMAGGSALWGALASRYGIPAALLFAAVGLLLALAMLSRYEVVIRDLDVSPTISTPAAEP
jgi:MFS family permease